MGGVEGKAGSMPSVDLLRWNMLKLLVSVVSVVGTKNLFLISASARSANAL